MSIHNPIGGGPQDPYDKYRKYRVESVENEKHEEERRKKFEEGAAKKPLPPGSFIFILLWRILDYFISLSNHGISNKSEKEVCETLHQLKAFFESMKWEDRSQDVEFLNHLSTIWHRALENSLRFRRSDPFSMAFHSLVKKIQNYPENQEHTLGYYLTEYTDEKWLPFPYLELIQKIHEQYQSDPAGSPLTLWLQELDEIISSLNS